MKRAAGTQGRGKAFHANGGMKTFKFGDSKKTMPPTLQLLHVNKLADQPDECVASEKRRMRIDSLNRGTAQIRTNRQGHFAELHQSPDAW